MSDMNDSNELMQALQKSKLMDTLHADPRTHRKILEAIKEVQPELSVPEIDAAKYVEPQLEQMRRENLEVRAELAKSRIKEQYGMSDQELVDTFTMMKDEGIARVDHAVELQRARESQRPRNAGQRPIELPNVAQLFSNPAQFARDEAAKVIQEFRSGRRG